MFWIFSQKPRAIKFWLYFHYSSVYLYSFSPYMKFQSRKKFWTMNFLSENVSFADNWLLSFLQFPYLLTSWIFVALSSTHFSHKYCQFNLRKERSLRLHCPELYQALLHHKIHCGGFINSQNGLAWKGP